ncbi:MAG: hypothetical protein ABSF74_02265 [Dehalococcoidia bacterium]
MNFDITKGFCNGLYIHGGSCEFTFHLVKHARSEITIINCKSCSCPAARSHRAQYAAKKRADRVGDRAA